MSRTPNASAYHRVHTVINALISASNEKQKMGIHLDLVALIESDRHLLVGEKAPLSASVISRLTQRFRATYELKLTDFTPPGVSQGGE